MRKNIDETEISYNNVDRSMQKDWKIREEEGTVVEKNMKLNINEPEKLAIVGKALSSEMRIRILELLENCHYNINEIAEKLQIPASSAAMHIKVLEEAGLIETELKAAVRGSMKICRRTVGSIAIRFDKKSSEKAETIPMPIGNFVDYHVEPTCGIVSETGHIDIEDEPAVFYNPRRIEAKLIWMGNGYLEYRFPNASLKKNVLKSIEVSAEVCSEDHEYNMEQQSDITLWINEIEVGTWRSPSDFGDRRGRLNPTWWPSQNSQYGMLKTWKIDANGSYLDGDIMSATALPAYHLDESEYISVKIGISPDAVKKGGMNLFGDEFGDHPQDIVMRLIYE